MANGTDFSEDPKSGKDDETSPKPSGKDETGPKGSGKDDETGPKGSGKGPGETGGNRPNEVAEDIFRRVTGLGGFLVVAFVAPMAPSSSNAGSATSPAGLAIAEVGSKAAASEQEAAIQQQAEKNAGQVLKASAASQAIVRRRGWKRKKR